MEVEGKIRLTLTPKSGVSAATGNAWMSQEYVLDYFWWPNQTEPSQMVMQLFGEDKIKNFNIRRNEKR